MFRTFKEIWNNLEFKEREYLKAGLYVILLLGAISIIIIPWVLTREFWSVVDYENTGAIGDTINGIAGPFIALLAAILTFLAFYIQYKANIQQKQQFSTSLQKEIDERRAQEMTWRVDRFENRFYELLKLHRANLDEMNIADRVKGRKCFIRLFNELKYTYSIVVDQYNASSINEKKLYRKHKLNKLKFSYTIFFYGIGVNSEKQFVSGFNDAELKLYEYCKTVMDNYQKDYIEAKKKYPDKRYYTFDLPLMAPADERTKIFFYKPFDGHSDLLGHYYRHLYQSVSYIINQDNSFLDFNTKYSYVKTLRAQLSNHEQLMLYYNSAAWFNDEWKEFFTDYRLIKNLPLGLADFDLKPEEKYKDDIIRLRSKGIEMFELHE